MPWNWPDWLFEGAMPPSEADPAMRQATALKLELDTLRLNDCLGHMTKLAL